jgi:hypothetical protein
MIRIAVAAFVMLCAASARASENYPETLEQALDTPCPPDCTTCHTRPSGGLLTANTPVGISMRRAGLKGDDTGTLLDAIATLEAEGTDSDMDGVPDVEEMHGGTDPNAAAGNLECWQPDLDENCALAGRALGERRGSPAMLAVWLTVAAFALARRTRAKRGRKEPQ